MVDLTNIISFVVCRPRGCAPTARIPKLPGSSQKLLRKIAEWSRHPFRRKKYSWLPTVERNTCQTDRKGPTD
jgi:hypothetical protein